MSYFCNNIPNILWGPLGPEEQFHLGLPNLSRGFRLICKKPCHKIMQRSVVLPIAWLARMAELAHKNGKIAQSGSAIQLP